MSKIKITSRLIANEAEARGWTVKFFDDNFSPLMRITTASGKSSLFKSSVTMADSYVGGSITNNKYETSLVLKDAGLPVPETILYDEATIGDFITKYGAVVIKPASADHGDGVRVNVKTLDEAHVAYKYAKNNTREGDAILVQAQLAGNDHRFLVVGDKVFITKRQKPYVIGDGIHTVRQLIDQKNQDPRRGTDRSTPLSIIDIQQAEMTLGDRIDTILGADERIDVLGTSNLGTGGESVALNDVTHQAFKQYALDAARLLGLRVCAIDIMCEDVSLSPGEQACGIIEMNVLPGIRMHHFPAEGEPVNAAAAILDEIFGEN